MVVVVAVTVVVVFVIEVVVVVSVVVDTVVAVVVVFVVVIVVVVAVTVVVVVVPVVVDTVVVLIVVEEIVVTDVTVVVVAVTDVVLVVVDGASLQASQVSEQLCLTASWKGANAETQSFFTPAHPTDFWNESGSISRRSTASLASLSWHVAGLPHPTWQATGLCF